MTTAFGISEHLAFCTVRIQCRKRSGGTSTGSGFFFNFFRSGNSFLPTVVTNRHVIRDAEEGTFYMTEEAPDGSPRIGTFHPHTVGNFEAGWLPHPDPGVDLCVMPIGGLLQQSQLAGRRYFFLGFESAMIPDAARLQQMAALDPVVMVGHPVGIWDDRNNMPVFRKGIAATHPYLDYQGRKEFVVDMACFPGSSGSPVLFVRSGLYSDKLGRNIVGDEVKLLGILYAGPQYTVEGTIVVAPAPTALQPVPVSQIPTNLGYVIKAERLLDFESILQSQLAAQQPPTPPINFSETISMPLSKDEGAE